MENWSSVDVGWISAVVDAKWLEPPRYSDLVAWVRERSRGRPLAYATFRTEPSSAFTRRAADGWSYRAWVQNHDQKIARAKGLFVEVLLAGTGARIRRSDDLTHPQYTGLDGLFQLQRLFIDSSTFIHSNTGEAERIPSATVYIKTDSIEDARKLLESARPVRHVRVIFRRDVCFGVDQKYPANHFFQALGGTCPEEASRLTPSLVCDWLVSGVNCRSESYSDRLGEPRRRE